MSNYLKSIFYIESISTWGRHNWVNQYTTNYTLQYSLDGITFISDRISNPLPANTNNADERINTLPSNIIARYIRITPTAWYSYPSLKIDAVGRSYVFSEIVIFIYSFVSIM